MQIGMLHSARYVHMRPVKCLFYVVIEYSNSILQLKLAISLTQKVHHTPCTDED
jgi:hypothetical protein